MQDIQNRLAESKKINLTIFCYHLLVYMVTLINGLTKGGRWNLNNQIFTGSRIIENIHDGYNLSGSTDFPPTTVYSTLQPILLGIISKITSLQTAEVIAIFIIAPLIATFLYYVTCKLAIQVSTIISKKEYFLLIHSTGLILFCTSTNYIFYASEMKPDSLALIFMTIALSLTINGLKHERNKYSSSMNKVLLCVTVLLAGLTKQQIILPLVVAAISLLANSETRKYGKLIALSSTGSIIVPSLLMNGYFKYTIESMAGRLTNPISKTAAWIFKSIFMSLAPLIILFITTPSKRVVGKLNFENNPMFDINVSRLKLKKIELGNVFRLSPIDYAVYITVPAVLSSWLAAQTLSTWNYGGNAGNIQAGLLYSGILIFPYVLKFFKTILKSQKEDRHNQFGKLLIRIVILLTIINLYKISARNSEAYGFDSITTFIHRDQSYAQLLKSRYLGRSPFFVDGDSAMIAKRAEINQLHSFMPVMHLSEGAKTRDEGIKVFNEFVKNNVRDGKIEYFTKFSIKNGDSFYHPSGDNDWLKNRIVVSDEVCFQPNDRYCHGEAIIK